MGSRLKTGLRLVFIVLSIVSFIVSGVAVKIALEIPKTIPVIVVIDDCAEVQTAKTADGLLTFTNPVYHSSPYYDWTPEQCASLDFQLEAGITELPVSASFLSICSGRWGNCETRLALLSVTAKSTCVSGCRTLTQDGASNTSFKPQSLHQTYRVTCSIGPCAYSLIMEIRINDAFYMGVKSLKMTVKGP